MHSNEHMHPIWKAFNKLAAAPDGNAGSTSKSGYAQGDPKAPARGEQKDVSQPLQVHDKQPNIPTQQMTGMIPGAEMPSDAFMTEMIKRNPDALQHYNMAVEMVSNDYKRMSHEERKSVPSQEDMARMFNDESMSQMGTMEESAQQQQPQQPGDKANEYMVDEQGNPVVDERGNPVPAGRPQPGQQAAPSQPGVGAPQAPQGVPGAQAQPAAEPEYQLDEQGNPVLDENGQPVPVDPNAAPAGEAPGKKAPPEEDKQYPFGQREKKDKKDKNKKAGTKSEDKEKEKAAGAEKKASLMEYLREQLLGEL